jgi:hypothetical protein
MEARPREGPAGRAEDAGLPTHVPPLWRTDANHRLRHQVDSIQRILEHLGEPIQPPPVASARGPPPWEEDADQREVAEDAHDRTPTRLWVPAPGESAVVTAASAHALSVHTRSAGGGLLVVSDPAYPGWQAFIDGQPTRLHEVYGVFRGVVIPPGEHDVAFRFHSRPFTVGLALSGFGLLAMGAAGVARAATVKSWSTREGKGASVTLLGSAINRS